MKRAYPTPLLRELCLQNLLSFGPDSVSLELRGLNVIIGPNGSGKSNLLEAIGLLRSAPNSAPKEIRDVVSKGGGVAEWIWKGAPGESATLDVLVAHPGSPSKLRHVIAFRAEEQGFTLSDERIEKPQPAKGQGKPYFYYSYQNGHPAVNVAGQERRLVRETVEPDRSILAQRRDPETYPELSYLAGAYERIRLYREWAFGRNTVFRNPQRADLRTDGLEEDFSNLGLFLSRIRKDPKVKRELLSALGNLYEGLNDFDVSIEGGTVQVYFTEGDFTIPATRLSDGTLRYLCLLAILLDPNPPPLICIEEPELGLHPDLLPGLARLMVEASSRTQLVVTTHAAGFVDAFTETPEAIIVCEKHEGQTSMQRLDAGKLRVWLESYRLGELWTSGELGGTRW